MCSSRYAAPEYGLPHLWRLPRQLSQKQQTVEACGFLPATVDYLLSDQLADKLAQRIDFRRSIGEMPQLSGSEHTDTVYICTVDKARNVVSFINSLFHPYGGLPGRSWALVTKTVLIVVQMGYFGPTHFVPELRRPISDLNNRDPHLWVNDKTSGELLAEIELPANATGAPITYMPVESNTLRSLLAEAHCLKNSSPLRFERRVTGIATLG